MASIAHGRALPTAPQALLPNHCTPALCPKHDTVPQALHCARSTALCRSTTPAALRPQHLWPQHYARSTAPRHCTQYCARSTYGPSTAPAALMAPALYAASTVAPALYAPSTVTQALYPKHCTPSIAPRHSTVPLALHPKHCTPVLCPQHCARSTMPLALWPSTVPQALMPPALCPRHCAPSTVPPAPYPSTVPQGNLPQGTAPQHCTPALCPSTMSQLCAPALYPIPAPYRTSPS